MSGNAPNSVRAWLTSLRKDPEFNRAIWDSITWGGPAEALWVNEDRVADYLATRWAAHWKQEVAEAFAPYEDVS